MVSWNTNNTEYLNTSISVFDENKKQKLVISTILGSQNYLFPIAYRLMHMTAFFEYAYIVYLILALFSCTIQRGFDCYNQALFLGQQDGAVHVIYAYHSDDPLSDVDIPKHQVRGSRSLNLLENLLKKPKLPNDLQYFEIRTDVSLYQCKVF